MRGTNIFAMIGKSVYESSAGRIRWQRNMWAVVGSRWDKRRLENKFGNLFTKDNGVLVKRQCAHCPCPPGGQSDFYYSGKWWSVPSTECRKCIYHRASGVGGFRFPRCTYKKPEDRSAVSKDALTQIGDMVERAVSQAEEMIK